MEPEQTCGACKYCVKNEKKLHEGTCRYNPPIVIGIPAPGPMGQLAIQQVSCWPSVATNRLGCFRWEGKIVTGK